MSSSRKPLANSAPKTANSRKRTPPTQPSPPSESDVQKELRECRAEVLCLRAKFNPADIAKHKIQTVTTEQIFQDALYKADIAKHKIQTVTTEQIFQDALYNAERDLQQYVEGASDSPLARELKDKLYKRDKEITSLKKTSKLEAEEITVLKRRCESLEIEYTKIKGMYDSVANKLPSKDDLRILERDYRQKEEALNKELNETKEKLKIYTQKLPNILSKRHDAETLQKELDETKSERDSLRRNHAALKKQLDSRNKELSEYMIERETLKAALAKGKSDIEELESTNHTLSDTVTKLKTDLSSAQNNDNKDLTATRSQISKLENKLQSSEDEADKLSQTLRELELELKQVKDDSKNTLNSKTQLESEMKKLRDDNENLSKEIAHQSEILHERDVEIDKLQVKLTEAGESGVYRSVDGRVSESDRDNELSRLQKECESLTVLVASLSKTQNNKQSSQVDTRQLKQEIHDMERMHARKSKESEQKLKEEKDAHARTKQAKDNLEMKCHDAFEKISQKEKKLLQQEANHKLLIERKDSTIKDLRREKTMVDPNANSKSDSKTLEASNKKMFEELEEMREQNNELRMRLSKVASSQILDGNAELVDLSDPFRPELLVEKFSELYDNEWTAALESSEAEGVPTIDSIEKLLKALFDAYKFCQEQSQVLTKRVLASFRFLPNNNKIELSKLPPKRLQVLRELVKIFATDLGQNVAEEYTKSYKPILLSKDVSDRYIHQCVSVCWLMSVQNPPLVLDTGRPSGTFDDTVYRHFTQSGDLVDFIVWPPVRIQQTGRLICKGIAQGK